MPAIVGETQLSSLQHVCNFPDGCRSEGIYTLNQTLNAFRLLPVHVILCFSPEVEVQRVQIRRMRWPIDWRSPTLGVGSVGPARPDIGLPFLFTFF